MTASEKTSFDDLPEDVIDLVLYPVISLLHSMAWTLADSPAREFELAREGHFLPAMVRAINFRLDPRLHDPAFADFLCVQLQTPRVARLLAGSPFALKTSANSLYLTVPKTGE